MCYRIWAQHERANAQNWNKHLAKILLLLPLHTHTQNHIDGNAGKIRSNPIKNLSAQANRQWFPFLIFSFRTFLPCKLADDNSHRCRYAIFENLNCQYANIDSAENFVFFFFFWSLNRWQIKNVRRLDSALISMVLVWNFANDALLLHCLAHFYDGTKNGRLIKTRNVSIAFDGSVFYACLHTFHNRWKMLSSIFVSFHFIRPFIWTSERCTSNEHSHSDCLNVFW